MVKPVVVPQLFMFIKRAFRYLAKLWSGCFETRNSKQSRYIKKSKISNNGKR